MVLTVVPELPGRNVVALQCFLVFGGSGAVDVFGIEKAVVEVIYGQFRPGLPVGA